jgi:hypothetical protein
MLKAGYYYLRLKEANDAFSSRRFCLEAFCFQPCLELYPMDQWNDEKINKLNLV